MIDGFFKFRHFSALCHIYSGASHPPEGISLMELASLSDLLGLEGLKEVTAYALKTNYCHSFHKVSFHENDFISFKVQFLHMKWFYVFSK